LIVTSNIESNAPPRYVFHHIPKCGGNSLLALLALRFFPVDDYARKGPGEMNHESADSFRARRLNLDELDWESPQPPILTGHFELPGCALFERYSETETPPYRRIVFLRDPLDRAISYFHYARRSGRFPLRHESLEAFLASLDNPMARLIAPNPKHALGALAKYWFVGTLETAALDLRRLAPLLGLEAKTMPHANRTSRPNIFLADSVFDEFKSRNSLDYQLWRTARDWSLAGGLERRRELGWRLPWFNEEERIRFCQPSSSSSARNGRITI
jgi:hypothetical protein